jgi:hypothetical protein
MKKRLLFLKQVDQSIVSPKDIRGHGDLKLAKGPLNRQ